MCKTGYYWYIYGDGNYADFDFTWKPAPWQSHYTHVWPTQWPQFNSIYLAHVDRVDAEFHLHNTIIFPRVVESRFEKLIDCNFSKTWTPHPWDPPYIYVFGNQHYPGTIMPTVRYTVPGATEEKFIEQPTARLLSSRTNWQVNEPIDESAWDWTWVPNPKDPPYIYVFGNQWLPPEIKSSLEYHVPGATERKYMDKRTTRLPQPDLFTHIKPVTDFDYSWEPNPKDPPYIYVFGNQWNDGPSEPTMEFCVPGATEKKYVESPCAKLVGNPTLFTSRYSCEFDYSWEPWRIDPGAPPYIYVFGNQWYPPEVDPTVEYRMPGATEKKFLSEPVAKLLATADSKWVALVDCDYDSSWHPEPGSPPYIYVFGNQWHSAEIMPTVEYHMTGATERKYMDLPIAKLREDKSRWTIPEEVDLTNIDFSWVPDPGAPPYVYHFGTEYQMSIGLTYTVPGATEPRFEGEAPKVQKEKSIVEVVDIFFVDRSNPTSQSRYELLLEKYPKMQKIRYANSITDTIKRCVSRAKTSKFWVISSEYNYDNFDFHWHAQPWQGYMTHVFPSQHNKWSDTFLINKWEFNRHISWAESIEQFPNLNFVKDQQVTKSDNLWDIYYIDHNNPESESQFKDLRETFPDIIKTRYANDYLSVMKRIMTNANTEYVWIINSVCDYTHFDFSWQPEPWQKEMIHCFANSRGDFNEKRGDTFYLHVESFKKQMAELELLDWFNVINYVDTQKVTRFPIPIVHYTSDNLVEEIKKYEFTTPYALFANREFGETEQVVDCLWTEKDRWVRPMTDSNGISLVPRDAKRYLKTQMYDYPHLYKYEKGVPFTYYADHPIDVVYISNGEPDAEQWFEHLEKVLDQRGSVMNLPKFSNKLHRVQNVNGRVAAYQAAAGLSTTPWFFAVFAKLEVNLNFNFNWQPDYWQQPKHYIFNAHNPVNGLEYGHMGMIAYNKGLVLANNDPGIDFTLSQPHESVPILSGTAHFNQDPWTTWRTAFRETLKLQLFMDTQPTLETEHRLDTWLNKAEGKHSQYSLMGAREAVAYYKEVNGDPAKLQLSFDWDWLRERYQKNSLTD